MTTGGVTRAEGPYFDELEVGRVFAGAPALTLTAGRAALHQSILGDRLRLALDDDLAARVTGTGSLAHPALVWNVAIGQSTLATQHVRANLFYRGLTFQRQPAIGDTLRTVTTVVGLRENTRREGRAPTGLAALRIRTVDQNDRPVLDFHRCAMLPLRSGQPTGHADDLSRFGDSPGLGPNAPSGWDHGAWAKAVRPGSPPSEGDRIEVVGGDVVTSAPELARLTLNIAAVHHDAAAGGAERLVYGGHTIGLALSQVTRAVPDLVTVLGWESCDHLGPVRESDTLRSTIDVRRVFALPGGWTGLDLAVAVAADVSDGGEPRAVLDWRFTALAG
jgi:acyl dehydratase